MIDRGGAERDRLREHRTESGEEVLVVYGRRRAGKTTLATTAFETFDGPTFSYLCDERGLRSERTPVCQDSLSARFVPRTTATNASRLATPAPWTNP